jgi:F0F1-type ATP synthase assembly protein I
MADDISGQGPEPDAGRSGYAGGNTLLTYVIGGITAWGLIGWGLDSLLSTRWLWIAGAILGAGGGYYLARQHKLTRPRRNRGRGTGDNT